MRKKEFVRRSLSMLLAGVLLFAGEPVRTGYQVSGQEEQTVAEADSSADNPAASSPEKGSLEETESPIWIRPQDNPDETGSLVMPEETSGEGVQNTSSGMPTAPEDAVSAGTSDPSEIADVPDISDAADASDAAGISETSGWTDAYGMTDPSVLIGTFGPDGSPADEDDAGQLLSDDITSEEADPASQGSPFVITSGEDASGDAKALPEDHEGSEAFPERETERIDEIETESEDFDEDDPLSVSEKTETAQTLQSITAGPFTVSLIGLQADHLPSLETVSEEQQPEPEEPGILCRFSLTEGKNGEKAVADADGKPSSCLLRITSSDREVAEKISAGSAPLLQMQDPSGGGILTVSSDWKITAGEAVFELTDPAAGLYQIADSAKQSEEDLQSEGEEPEQDHYEEREQPEKASEEESEEDEFPEEDHENLEAGVDPVMDFSVPESLVCAEKIFRDHDVYFAATDCSLYFDEAADGLTVYAVPEEGRVITGIRAWKVVSREDLTLYTGLDTLEEIALTQPYYDEDGTYSARIPAQGCDLLVIANAMMLPVSSLQEPKLAGTLKMADVAVDQKLFENYGAFVRYGDATTSLKRIKIRVNTGGKTIDKYCYVYCLQASLDNAGTAGTVRYLENSQAAKEKYSWLIKALYLASGDDIWGETFTNSDGKYSLNLDTWLRQKGIGGNALSVNGAKFKISGNQAAFMHFVLSYIYHESGLTDVSFDWASSHADGGADVRLTAAQQSLVKEAANAIKKLDDPTVGFDAKGSSEKKVTAVCSGGVSRTPEITYTAYRENSITLALGSDVTAYRSDGTRLGNGNVRIPGGTVFYLQTEKLSDRTTTYTCVPAVYSGGQALVKTTGSTTWQDLGLAAITTGDALKLEVTWPELTRLYAVKIIKHDASTGNSTPVNSQYSLKGAKYGIYSASSAAGTPMATVTIGENGTGTSPASFESGKTYYVKEISAPSGYALDPKVYPVKIGNQTAAVTSEDSPLMVPIIVEKQAATGQIKTDPALYTLTGAKYTLYSDQACTKSLEVLTIGSSNKAETKRNYPAGTYYLRETSGPSCGLYQLDSSVHKITISLSTATSGKAVTVRSEEKPVTVRIAVQKSDARSGKDAPYPGGTFEGAQFGLYSDEACSSLIETLTTNREGYAVCKNGLPVSSYWIKEMKAPAGYELYPSVMAVSADTLKKEAAAGSLTHTVKVPEEPVMGDVEIVKHLKSTVDEGAELKEGLKGIEFTFTCLSDPEAVFTGNDGRENILVTDENGFASTRPAKGEDGGAPTPALVCGEWEIRETRTPEGFEPAEPFTVKIDGSVPVVHYDLDNLQISSRIRIVKKDLDTGSILPVSGIQFGIRKEDGTWLTQTVSESGETTDLFETDETGTVDLPQRLAYGSYRLCERGGIPEGCLAAEDLAFSVTDSRPDPEDPLILEMKNPPQKGQIRIEKKDAQTKEALAHAVFTVTVEEDITDAAGIIRTGIDSDGKTTELKAGVTVAGLETDEKGTALSGLLYPGVYRISETAAPDGYVTGEDVVVELKPDPEVETVLLTVPLENRKTTLRIRKLAGSVSSSAGEGGGTGGESSMEDPLETTEGQETTQSSEAEAPSDHQKEADAQLLSATGENSQAESSDSAAAWSTGQILAGVTFRVKPEGAQDDDSQLCMTGEDGEIVVQNLRHGTKYIVTETDTVPGYVRDETPQTFEVDESGRIDGLDHKDLVFVNVPVVLDISKQDMADGQEIEGARLALYTEDGTLYHEWTTGKTPVRFTAIPPGSYTLTERIPADGYATAESITFTVEPTGDIQRQVMKDERTKVQITKSDITDGAPVIGATLIIRNTDGEEVARWVTTQEPYYIEMLPVGTYTLTEITAPAGYQKAETITFTVADTGVLQKVDMKDAPEETESETPEETPPQKETQTPGGSEPQSEPQPPAVNQPPKETEAPKQNKQPETSAGTSARVQEKASQAAPKTGDDTPLVPLCAALMLSGMYLVAVWRKKRSRS